MHSVYFHGQIFSLTLPLIWSSDLMLHIVEPDLDLHCLFRSACPNTQGNCRIQQYSPVIFFQDCGCQLLIIFLNIFKTDTEGVPLWSDQFLDFRQILLFSINIIPKNTQQHRSR